MNEIKIIVKFKEHECYFEDEKDIKSLISGDYNSTKLVFDFDIEDGIKVFEMKNENNEIVYVDEIENNELILVGKDENDNNCTLFNTKGTYAFEVTLYGNDSKLTSVHGAFSVQQEEVVISDDVAESHLPIFDEMINNLEDALDEVDNLDIDVKKVNHTATIEITKKDGTTKEVEILDGVNGQDGKDGQDGVNGQDGITPTIGQNGNWYLGETDTGKPSRGLQGIQGIQGETGAKGDKGETGAKGDKGEKGDKGDKGDTGNNGQDGYTPQKGIDYFTPEDISSLNIPSKLSDLNDDLGNNPVHTHSQYLTSHQDISSKQDITDNTLTTNNKTVPTAINEVNSIAKGANQALSFSNYQSMITIFNNLANNVYKVGQNVMIITLNVPDLWISGIESTSQSYTYTSDSDFVNDLVTNGYVQVGYYKLSALETQKVDLTNYVTNTDYANTSKAGVIKSSSTYATNVSSGVLQSATKTYSDYTSGNDNMFISKGTLENVFTGKGFITSHQDITGKEDKSNKVTSLSASSTDTQYPSAKCVYDYIQSLDGDEVNY